MDTVLLERAHERAPLRLGVEAHGIELDTLVPRLHRIARGILRNDDLALDAVQEALVCLWMEDEPPRELHGWLVRAVVHRSLHVMRSLERRRRHEEFAARERPVRDDFDDPASVSRGRELLEQIEEALRALPSGFDTAFRMREIEGLDYAEIAERLRVPVGTVRSRLNRARAMLRERLWSFDDEACFLCARAPSTRRVRA